MEVIRYVPYALLSDTFASDPAFLALAGRKGQLYDTLKASYVDLLTHASHQTSNGFLHEQEALEFCRGKRRVLDLLCTAVLQRPAMLHRKGDVCECLRGDWVDGYAFLLHAFLKKNPSRSEVERNRAQKADLRDDRLKLAVFERDGLCCRYCRSGPLSPNAGRARDRRKLRQFDHVDPDRPAGPDATNLVTACGVCNEHKGHRTPDEADMVLLPPPTVSEAASWTARGLALFDRPDRSQIVHESIPDREHDAEPVRDPILDLDADPTFATSDDVTGEVRPDQVVDGSDRPGGRSQKGAGSGRGAGSGDQGPAPPPRRQPGAQPARTSADPDIYHRRSRARAPDPDYQWPAGAVPVEPRRPEEGPSP